MLILFVSSIFLVIKVDVGKMEEDFTILYKTII